MQKDLKNNDQLRYKANVYMLAGLACYSPLGILASQIHNIFPCNFWEMTAFISQLFFGIILAYFPGIYFLQKGETLLKYVKEKD